MSLATLIANTRKVLASDAAKGHVVFAAQGKNPVPVSRELVTSG